MAEKACDKCNGTGQVYIPAGKTYQTCAKCHGSGKISN